MTLESIQSDLRQAQLDRDEVKVATLRLLISEVKNLQIQKGGEITEDDIIVVIKKELKKRQESITLYEGAGRGELAEKEKGEAEILKDYLPEQLSTEELTKIVEDSINELGAKTIADMGRVIGKVLSVAGSQADGGEVSKLVREKLAV